LEILEIPLEKINRKDVRHGFPPTFRHGEFPNNKLGLGLIIWPIRVAGGFVTAPSSKPLTTVSPPKALGSVEIRQLISIQLG